MAKASGKKTGKTKKEILDDAIAEAVGTGKELHLDSVDFSDPNRPKTCLEVDFPILPINHVAAIEGNAGKPIYQMSKWWARRRSSVFRAMLIAAATKAPDDPGEAAKLVWDSYYGNHQKNKAFKNLKVADIFMGGGTTIVEGARLGMQMYGNDLNPVAWFVVKSELAQVDPVDVQKLLDQIEAEIKPQIMPFYACDCPRGHKGKWTQKSTGEIKGSDFDPLILEPNERANYEYDGPEVIYTFWAKHGPCQATGCGHRTPIMSTPVVALKTLTVKAWADYSCGKCQKSFDIEQHDARIAPAALFVCASDEKPYAAMNDAGGFACPHCGHKHQDKAAKDKGESISLGKAKNKGVECTLLIHPDWLKGSSGKSPGGSLYGGSMTDDPAETASWIIERSRHLKLVEVRGALPENVACDDHCSFFTDQRGGTVPKRSGFACKEETCGVVQDLLSSVKRFGKVAPFSPYAIQGYCPQCDRLGLPYSGRFFNTPTNAAAFSASCLEWSKRRDSELDAFWPKSQIPVGAEIGPHDVNGHHYSHWFTLFNERQLLILSLLLKSVVSTSTVSTAAKEAVLAAFQQYIRNQNMFCFWDIGYDKLVPAMSSNNFHPKSNVVENSVFSKLGRGNWQSCAATLLEALQWRKEPWETVPTAVLSEANVDITGVKSKSFKTFPNDPVLFNANCFCESSSSLDSMASDSFDLVITDPPFGDLLQYSELSDFFYVWLRLALRTTYPRYFEAEYTPKALEAVANRVRHPDDPDAFYCRLLTECWREARRILKPEGLLAFTFHHSEDEPWVAVLESLFRAGFYLVATFPVRSDETKGDGDFGSQKIEFDIVHVCRKRIEETQEISWARLRRQILADVRQLQDILVHHSKEGLQEADLQVIRRGKALEYYSKHYGKVYIEKGREFTVKEALAGINQLLDDQRDSTSEVPPVDAEPYTRQFLRLFRGYSSLERGELQKFLRGTGVSPAEFVERGWCFEDKKVFHVTSPVQLAQQWKGVSRQGMGRDFDQSMFLIGGCYENSGIRVQDTLNSDRFIPHPATGAVIDWFTRHGGDSQMKAAAKLAKQIYTKWEASNEPKVRAAQKTFEFDGDV